MRGGERIAGRPDQLVQVIHGRDLGDWMLTAAKNGVSGDFNLTGQPFTMESLLNAINVRVDADNTIVYTSDEFLQEQEVPRLIRSPTGFHRRQPV